MLFTAFIFGALAASLALILELVFLNFGSSLRYSTTPLDFSELQVLALVALIEEGARFLLLRQYVGRFLADTPLPFLFLLGIGLAFGLGYSSLEFGLLLSQGPPSLPALFGIITLHTLLSLFFALALTKKLSLGLFFVFLFATFAHLSYNLFLAFFAS